MAVAAGLAGTIRGVTPLELTVATLTHPLVLAAVMLLAACHIAHDCTARGALRFCGASIAAWLVAHGLKILVGDPRPAGGVIDAWGNGWPSGHAALGAAAAVTLWFTLAPRRRTRAGRVALAAGLALGALALTWTRLFLGVHDLGDAAGGLAVGAAIGYLFRPRRA